MIPLKIAVNHPPFHIKKQVVDGMVILMLLTSLWACKPAKKETQTKDERLKKALKVLVDQLPSKEGTLRDTIILHSTSTLKKFYKKNHHQPVWIEADSIQTIGYAMLDVIQQVQLHGLFSENYHLEEITDIQKKFTEDSLQQKDLTEWSRLEILLTDAFLTIARHLEYGHLPLDSLRDNPSFSAEKYLQTLDQAIESKQPADVLSALEPTSPHYQNLKKALPSFLRQANLLKKYTYLAYPYQDSLLFIETLIKRLKEDHYIDSNVKSLDATELVSTLKLFQKARGLKVDGKYGPEVVNALNNNDAEKFFKAAITMDRHRRERDSFPEKYLLVNLPAFRLSAYEKDSLALESRVIIGKPKTPTPLLTSNMNQLVVYPTWTIPASIIEDEILPALKRDAGYLQKKGYRLYEHSGDEVDPNTVDWKKYKKGMPYKIVQGEGVGNALGIMKFNFPNEHFVYLHDTNQRSLFANENRSLSHGCVRVQNWEGLYKYVIHLDSIAAKKENKPFTSSDTIRSWLKQEKRRVVKLTHQLPIFFRYYTAMGVDGKLETFSDVYNEDQWYRTMIQSSFVNSNNRK